MSAKRDKDTRLAKRLPIKASIVFKPFAEVTEAESVDMSKTGIRFNTKEPLRIAIKITVGKKSDTYIARLVWAKRAEAGGMTYGFEYDIGEGAKGNISLGGE